MGVGARSQSGPISELPNLREGLRETVPLSNKISAHGAKKQENVYTGDYILGIATMHKSNAVPITSKQAAEDISKMRRG